MLRQYELDFRKAEDENLRQRHSRANGLTALPGELGDDDQLRFRIVPKNGGHFFEQRDDVRSIRLSGLQPEIVEVPLYLSARIQRECPAASTCSRPRGD